MIRPQMRRAIFIESGAFSFIFPLLFLKVIVCSRVGRFETKGLAPIFVSSESDQQVTSAIQSRFEVAMTELPENIDPASYSEFIYLYKTTRNLFNYNCSDFLIKILFTGASSPRSLLVVNLYSISHLPSRLNRNCFGIIFHRKSARELV